MLLTVFIHHPSTKSCAIHPQVSFSNHLGTYSLTYKSGMGSCLCESIPDSNLLFVLSYFTTTFFPPMILMHFRGLLIRLPSRVNILALFWPLLIIWSMPTGSISICHGPVTWHTCCRIILIHRKTTAGSSLEACRLLSGKTGTVPIIHLDYQK